MKATGTVSGPWSRQAPAGPTTISAPPGLKKARWREFQQMERTWQRLALHLLGRAELIPPWAMGITSAISGEGKTTTAMGLAAALARESGQTVALVEADFLTPTLASDLGLRSEAGLVDVLRGERALRDALQGSGTEGLLVLPSGLAGPGATEVDRSTRLLRHRASALLHDLKQEAGYVVVDLPAVAASAHSEALVHEMDGVLLVVRAGVTPLRLVAEAAHLIGRERLTGLVHLGPPSAVPAWLSRLFGE